MLQPVKIVLYYDAVRLAVPPAATSETADRYQAVFGILLEQFEQLKFVLVTKEPNLEKLRLKLIQLTHNKTTNEIIPGNISEISDKILTGETTGYSGDLS